jgi:glutaredoxin-related protein
MLSEAGRDYVEIPLPHTIRSKALGAIAKAQTVPQVFVGGTLIGGSQELESFLAKSQSPSARSKADVRQA